MRLNNNAFCLLRKPARIKVVAFMLVMHHKFIRMHNMDIETLDLRQLDAFAAVMSAGSITGAARLLGRSQPAVTRLIQDLEANLGFELLHRNGPRITPTDQGLLFHDEVERLLVGLKHIADRAQAIAKLRVPTIEIAAIPALAAGIIPKLSPVSTKGSSLTNCICDPPRPSMSCKRYRSARRISALPACPSSILALKCIGSLKYRALRCSPKTIPWLGPMSLP
jgi:hypothetical protein